MVEIVALRQFRPRSSGRNDEPHRVRYSRCIALSAYDAG